MVSSLTEHLLAAPQENEHNLNNFEDRDSADYPLGDVLSELCID